VNRQQLSLVVVLGLINSIPAFAGGLSEQGGGWRTSSEETASSTLSGKLYRNSADSNGSAPYVVLDRWSVVRGYVAAAQGVELESCVGQQVSLQGTIKTLPGGDMPYMTCQRILSGNAEVARTRTQKTSAPIRHESFAPVVQSQQPEEVEVQPGLLSRSDMAAEPATQTVTLPLREVVLESRTLQAADAADASQDHHSVPLAHRADPRRLRHPAVQSTNYQETVPAPIPAGEVHHSPMPTDPALDPTPMGEGPMVSEGPIVGHGTVGCDSCREGSCDSPCNEISDGPCWGPRRPLFCWGPTGIWVKADYLQWWERGMHVPALVTSGPSAEQPGYIGENGTVVLFGDEDINNKSQSGGRIQAGLWLNPCMTFGFEGEFLSLADATTDFRMWSDGNPIVSRPFYSTGRTDANGNRLPDIENVEIVASPRPGYDGAIDISATTRFHGAGAHFLFTTCRQEGCWTDDCGSCTTYHDRFRAIFVAGYRYLDLEDQLGITENLTSTQPGPVNPQDPNGIQGVSTFLIHDQFNTQNTFNGADLGMKFEFQRNRWSLDMFPRIALGSTHSTVDISGSTRTTSPAGVQATAPGGLLAQPTNSNHYSRDDFAVVPELDLNLGFQFTNHTRVVFGYSALYWSKVARAGDQIDRTVNVSTLPNAAANGVTPVGDLTRPRFTFQESGFWAQGFNVGLDCRW